MELSLTTKASWSASVLRIHLRAWFSYTQEIWGGGGLCMPVPNITDAVLEVAITPCTPPAGGTPVLGPVPLSSEGPSSWKARGVPTPHEDVWGLALCKNRRLLCGSQFILCERPRPGLGMAASSPVQTCGLTDSLWQRAPDVKVLGQVMETNMRMGEVEEEGDGWKYKSSRMSLCLIAAKCSTRAIRPK